MDELFNITVYLQPSDAMQAYSNQLAEFKEQLIKQLGDRKLRPVVPHVDAKDLTFADIKAIATRAMNTPDTEETTA